MVEPHDGMTLGAQAWPALPEPRPHRDVAKEKADCSVNLRHLIVTGYVLHPPRPLPDAA